MKNINYLLFLTAIAFLTSCAKEPEACFDFTPQSAIVNEPVSFTNCSEDAEDYEWNFGDGGTATGAAASHIYSATGTFTVTLTVENKKGTDQTNKQIIVGGNDPNLQDCDENNYGWVKVHNTHDSNYDIWINNTYKGSVSGYGTSASFQYPAGTSIHVYALQLDGYLVYPSEFDAYGTIVECQTITTNYYMPTVNQ